MVRSFASYLLFFFFFFTFLCVLVSQGTSAFAQLFFLFCKNDMAYSFIIKLLCFCIWMISGIYLFLAHWKQRDDFVKSSLAVCVCIIFLFTWLFLITKPEEDYINTLHFNYYEVIYFDFFSLIDLNFFEILISSFFYIFLLFLPCIFLIFNWYFDMRKAWHRIAIRFFPSINVCIMTLIASAFQPYYDKPNLYLYIDFLFFIITLICIVVLFLKKNFLFKFYEYMNLLLLLLLIFTVLTCSNILVQSDYYNARYCFYLIAFLAWCCEWMFGDFEKQTA